MHGAPQPSQAASPRLLPGLALAITGAITFSAKAIIVKLAYRYGADAVTMIMLRMLFALPIFLLMAWWASRGKAPLSLRDWRGVVGLGFCGYYLSSLLDFAGLQFVSATLERLILYLNPTLVMLLGWLLYRKQVARLQVGGMALSYSGVVVVFGQEVQLDGGQTAIGSALILASAVSYAVYMVYSGQLVKRLGALRLVGLATSVACGFALLQYALLRPLGAIAAIAPQVVWLSVLNATLCTALPVLLVMMAIERIGPALSAQSGMVGPLATIMMGVLILGEPFTAWIAVGTVLVIAGIFVVSRAPR